MKKKAFTAFLAVSVLLLTACAGSALSDPAPVMELVPAEAEYEQPEYEVIPFTSGNQVQAEDGTVLAHYNYQALRLALHNEDAVSPEDAETAARNIDTFNEKMDSVTAGLMEQAAELSAHLPEEYEVYGAPAMAYEDDAETSAVFTGDIISVCLYRYSFTGGAHPNSYVMGWLFDLRTGQFILDPSQLAEDPAAFHDSVAEILIEKADSDLPGSCPGGYWDDYQDIIRGGHSGVTLFDEKGMKVLYAPYELGPYAIGQVELYLSWEELEPLLGESGMARLGMAEES